MVTHILNSGTISSFTGRYRLRLRPSSSDLVIWLATFAIGFIARPIGALVFGYLGDKIGRKSTVVITLSMMGTCTFLVGCLPTYDNIGPAAGIILICLRIMQGLAIGGEYGGAVTYVRPKLIADNGAFSSAPSWVLYQLPVYHRRNQLLLLDDDGDHFARCCWRSGIFIVRMANPISVLCRLDSCIAVYPLPAWRVPSLSERTAGGTHRGQPAGILRHRHR